MYEIKETGNEYPTKTQVFSKQERQIAFVNALKAVDREKRMQQMVKAVFDWLKPDNNDVEHLTNAE